MRDKQICVYRLEDPIFSALPDLRLIASPSDRNQLRSVLSGETVDVLIVDLDQRDALDAIVEALEIKSGMAVVGVIGSNDLQKCISAQRAGCRQLATRPLNENDLVLAIRKAMNESSETPEWGKTISVIPACGGAGGSTVSCYLATALAEAAKSTAAVIDLDLEFGTVASNWDITPRYTIADIASAGTVDRMLIEDAMIDLPCSVGILPRPLQIEQAHSVHEAIVRNLIEAARTLYPFVILDLPRKMDAIAGAAIQSSDKLLIVVELTVSAVDNAARLTDSLVRFGLSPETMEYVVNRYRKGVHSVTIENLEGRVGKKVFGVLPNHYKTLAAASDLGQPVDAQNPVRKAIAELAAKLLARKPQATDDESGGGWMSGLKFARKSTEKTAR